MSKITLTNLVNLQNETTAVNAINSNNAAITTAVNDCLSRAVGAHANGPNQMNDDLDMNGNQIFNLPAPSTLNAPARLVDVVSNPTIVVPGTGTSGHTVPFLDGNNTWSGTNTFNINNVTTENVTGTATFSNPIVVPANSIANASLGTMAANTVKGSIAGGTPADLTKTQLTTLINPATAALSGAVPAFPNNTTTFFRGDGTYASLPTSTVTLLNTMNASSSASLADTTSFTTTYSIYEIVLTNVIPSTSSTTLLLQIHASGAFQTAGYLTNAYAVIAGVGGGAASTTGIQLGTNNQINSYPGISGMIRCYTPTDAVTTKNFVGEMGGLTVTPAAYTLITSGIWNTGGAIDGFRILFSAGNILSGSVKVYGRT